MADIVINTQLKFDDSSILPAMRRIAGGFNEIFTEGSKSVERVGRAFEIVNSKAESSVSSIKNALASMIAAGKGSSDAANALREGLAKSSTEAEKLAAAMKQVEAELKASQKLTPGESFSKALEDAKSNASKLQLELAKILATQGESSKEYRTAVANLKSANTEAEKLEGALKRAEKAGSTKASGGAIASGLKQSFSKGTEEASFDSSSIGNIATKLGSLTTPVGLAAAGTDALVKGFKVVIDVGQKFETALTSIGSKTGVSGVALEKIGNKAQEMSAKFGGTATEQLTTFEAIISEFGAGIAKTPENLAMVSNSINTFSKAAGVEPTKAIELLSGAMEQFGVDIKNTSEVANKSPQFINTMAAAARSGGANIEQIGEAMKTAGDSMRNANLSFEQGNAVIQVLGKGGKTGAEAGTELKGVLDRISGQELIPKEGLARLKSLGVDMKKVTDTSLPLETRLTELGKASGDATAFTKVFGEQNAETAKILTDGAGSIGTLSKEITGTSAATDGASQKLNTMAEKISGTKAKLENFAVDIYKVIAPILTNVIGVVSEAFSVVSNALGPIFKDLGSSFSSLYDVLAPVLAFIAGEIIVGIVQSISLAGVTIKVFADAVVGIFKAIVAGLQPAIDWFKDAFDIGDDVQKSFDPMQLLQTIASKTADTIKLFGDILSSVAAFSAAVLEVSLKALVGTVKFLYNGLVFLVDIFSSGKKEIGSTGEEVKKTGGFFTTLMNVVQNAPAIITALTASFRAFTGVIGDLFENFSLSKLKDLFSGDSVRKAFNDSMKDSFNKKNQEETVKQFGETVKRISKIASDGNKELLETERSSALARLAVKEREGAIAFDKAEAIRNELKALSVADATPPPPKKTPPPPAKTPAIDTKKIEEDETKGLLDAIEHRKKDREDYARTTIKNETNLAITLIQIQADAENAAINVKINAANKILEVDKNQKDKSKKLNEDEIQAILDNIDSLNNESVKITKNSQAKIMLEQGKGFIQELENHEKTNEAKLKSDVEYAKATIERTEKRVTQTSKDEEAKLKDLNAAKIDYIQKTNALELNDLLNKNSQVVKAQDDLREALASGDENKKKAAEKIYEEVVKKAIESDTIILAHSEQTNSELQNQKKIYNQQLTDLSISQITDSTERERQTKQAALDKQYQEDLVKLGTNEQAKAELTKKYQADKYDTDVEYNRKSSDLWVQSAQLIEDAGLNIAKSFADSMGSTFDDLSQGFEDFANDVKKRIAESKKDNTKSTEEEAGKLLDALKKHEISYAEYQAKLADLNKKQAKTNVTTTERANLAIGQAFSVLAKQGNDALDSTLKDVAKTSKSFATAYKAAGKDSEKQNDALAAHWKEFSGQIVEAGQDMGLSIAGVLGQMAAQGKLTLESAGKAAAAIALDTVSKLVLTQAPAILAIFAGAIPPPFGFIAGLAAIGVVQALLAATKSAIIGDGFYKGGYTGDGNAHESAGVVHKGEVVFESQITKNQKTELLELRSLLQRGLKLSEIIEGYNISKSFERISEQSRDFSNTYIDTSGKLQTVASPVFVPQQNVNQSNIEMIAMRSELTQIRKLLAKAKIIERETKHVSAVRLSVEENPQFRIRQEKQALRLERARG